MSSGSPLLAEVTVLAHGAGPRALAEELLRLLPPPFAARGVVPLELRLETLLDRQRGQLDASRLLELLPPPGPNALLLALLETDLFLPVLTYVFGASELGGRRCALSLARLAPANAEPALLLRRACIEAVHELGHGLGLVHCPVPTCPMHRTLWPEAIDLKELAPCPSCHAALESALGRAV